LRQIEKGEDSLQLEEVRIRRYATIFLRSQEAEVDEVTSVEKDSLFVARTGIANEAKRSTGFIVLFQWVFIHGLSNLKNN
jgi:hypothetical protein